METDQIDLFISQWSRERPDLDASPLAVVSRILMLSRHLEFSADRALAPFGLTLWQFDVLAALRRSGAPFKLSPTQLMGFVTLSSGAMTNRIDRLEEMGLVRREEDPDDRRGVLITLTPEGRKLVDQAIAVRLEDARRNLATYTKTDEKVVAALLRRLLVVFQGTGVGGSASRRRLARANGFASQ
ncbi:MAG: MarR family transcriptional regulator [Planctomycetes bacterium]|nr:MarR family transcriptional regulator [Planctomycetota bacterium]